MEETGSGIPSAMQTRVVCGGGRQPVREEASGVMWSNAPKPRSQRGQEVPEPETDRSLWAGVARPVKESIIWSYNWQNMARAY